MGNKGFSILEVLVAMILLSIIVSGMLATFSIVGKGPGKLDLPELKGLIFARDTLEKLKNNVSEDPARGGDPTRRGYAPLVDSDPNPANGTTYSDPTGNPSFTRTYTVYDMDINSDGITDCKKVTVKVTW